MWKVFGSYENVLRLTLQDYEAPQQYAREIRALKWVFHSYRQTLDISITCGLSAKIQERFEQNAWHSSHLTSLLNDHHAKDMKNISNRVEKCALGQFKEWKICINFYWRINHNIIQMGQYFILLRRDLPLFWTWERPRHQCLLGDKSHTLVFSCDKNHCSWCHSYFHMMVKH